MRDRLIELLKKAPLCNKDFDLQYSDGTIEKIADYLLENGAIVPPCKVGDVVYFAKEDYHDSAIIDGIHITEQGVLFTWVQYEVGYELTEVWDEGEFYIDEIGKTVFLTREEALAKLKEGVQECQKNRL